jgi:hypothetical protein
MGPDDIVPTGTEMAPTVETASPAVTDPVPAPAPTPDPATSEPAKPASVRDSVRAAFDKLAKDAGEPKPVDPAKPAAATNRDPATGRFAAKPAQPGEPAAQEPSAASEPAKPDEAKPSDTRPAAPAAGPPPGWSVTSKAAWEQLPESVRADIAKREGEVQQGLAALRDYKDLKPYAEMATRSGTTLAAAVQRYVTMEGALRHDPAQGLMAVAHNIGLSKEQAAELFAQLAGALGARPTSAPQPNGGQPSTRQPSPGGSDQNDPLMEVIGPLIERALGPVSQRLADQNAKLGTLETHLTQRQQADQNARQRGVAEAIEKFATDPKHRYFPDLEETISRLFESGMVERTADPMGDLVKAYEMAAHFHPEVREALISERLKAQEEEAKAKAKAREDEARAKAEAARRAAVSLNGHPTGGAAAPARTAPAGISVRDSVRAAVQQLSSGV